MTFGGPVRMLVNLFNNGVLAAAELPVVGDYVKRYITSIHYIGRKSGKSFSLPIGYRRTGDTVRISVALPEQKSWWRNFLGDGARMSIDLDGAERTGHAVAVRDERGHVTVTLSLDS